MQTQIKSLAAAALFAGAITTGALISSQGNHQPVAVNGSPQVNGTPSPDDAPFLQIPALTPGDTLTGVGAKDVCTKGYAGQTRNVPQSEKAEIMQEYKQAGRMFLTREPIEIDHLISLELGGSNDKKNLWAQPYDTVPWNAHVKDKLEDRMHEEVCDQYKRSPGDGSADILLRANQAAIRTNWITSYLKRFPAPGA